MRLVCKRETCCRRPTKIDAWSVNNAPPNLLSGLSESVHGFVSYFCLGLIACELSLFNATDPSGLLACLSVSCLYSITMMSKGIHVTRRSKLTMTIQFAPWKSTALDIRSFQQHIALMPHLICLPSQNSDLIMTSQINTA